MSPENNGWEEWGRHVLKELERLSQGQDALRNDVGGIRVDVQDLKTRAGLWGAVGGIVVLGLAWLKSQLARGSQ